MKIKSVLILLSTCIYFCLPCVVFCADWKYYGGMEKGEIGPVTLFFDADSVKTTRGNIRVWIEAVPTKEIKDTFTKKSSSIMEKVGGKVASGYKLPYGIAAQRLDNSQALSAVSYEIIVNDYPVNPVFKIYEEINCDEMKGISLQLMKFDKNGQIQSTRGTEWEYIAPGSNSAALAAILCDSQ